MEEMGVSKGASATGERDKERRGPKKNSAIGGRVRAQDKQRNAYATVKGSASDGIGGSKACKGMRR